MELNGFPCTAKGIEFSIVKWNCIELMNGILLHFIGLHEISHAFQITPSHILKPIDLIPIETVF